MSQLTMARDRALRGEQAWIDTGFRFSSRPCVPLLIVQPEHVDRLGTVTAAAELAGGMCGAVLMSQSVLTSRKDEN